MKLLINKLYREMIIGLVCLALLPATGICGSGIEEQMDRVFTDPSFHRAIWGVKVVSLDSGNIVYERNAHKLLIPASNMKLVTAASVLRLLGREYVFETPVKSTGKITGGVLHGDLIIEGSGDPTMGARFTVQDHSSPLKGDPWKVFVSWADNLKKMGIRKIDGNLVGDDHLFEQVNLGDGWAWDDMAYGYAAGFGALQFNETMAFIKIVPAGEIGSPASAELIPRLESMSLESSLTTVAPECDSEIQISRSGRKFVLSGNIVSDSGTVFRSVALPDPTAYFLDALLETLSRNGITVSGKTLDIDDYPGFQSENTRILFTHKSPPMKEILSVMLEVSQNQYAETLFRLLDKSEEGKGDGEAVETVEGILNAMGIPGDAREIVDGSGLSRNNLVTADSIVRILQYMYRKDDAEAFMAMLPESGVKGTIKGRMNGTRAEEKVFAKTGTLGWVRALSGYLKTEKGEMLAFSMLVNNYNQPRQSAEYLQDQALEILVGY